MATALDSKIKAQYGTLDFLVDTIRKEDENEVRRRLQRFVLEAISAPIRRNYERDASLNYQYTENDFYTDEELAELAQRGQPPTKRNEIAPILERIAGQFIQTRQAVTFLGRNTPADDPTGQVAQDYQRWNDQQNEYEFQEQDLCWDGLVGGVGWLKSYMKKNELGQKYECTRVVNPFYVYKDPFSVKYNPNDDAKYICEGSWMDLEDAMALVPGQEDRLLEQIDGWTGSMLPDASAVAASLQNEQMLSSAMYAMSIQGAGLRRRVRPFEVWYKRKVRVYHLYTKDKILALAVPLDNKTAREVVKQLGDSVVAVPTYQDRMYVGLILGSLVLHHDVSEHETNLFPYIPFYSGLRKNGAPLALCSRLVPINEAINKRESKALALLSNRQVIAEKNAVEDPDAFTTEVAKPDGYCEVNEGAISGQAPKVIIRDNQDMGAAQVQLLQEDKDAMRRVSGQGNESMGMPSEVRSGSGIARKQMMSNLIVTPVQNNLRRTRVMRAKLSYAYMKQYLTEEMAFQITDDPNAAKTVTVTKDVISNIKSRIYDIVVTEMKDYATLREQQTEMLLTALPQLAQHGSWMVKLGIQLSELRDKEGLLRMIDAQSQPPPVQPKVNLAMTWQDLTPEMQAYLAFALWKSPELAQALMQKGDDPAFLAKLKAGLIETQIKEGTRATIERGKLDLSALSTAVEGKMNMIDFMSGQSKPAQGQAESQPPDEGMEQ